MLVSTCTRSARVHPVIDMCDQNSVKVNVYRHTQCVRERERETGVEV